MDPVASLLLARYRLAVARRPDLLHRVPWYAIEGARIRAMAVAAGVDPDRAILAAAVLSPAVKWESLMDRLPAFLRAFAGQADRPSFPGYGGNVRKAWRTLAGLDRPTGPKVSRFAMNLAGDESPVTVDRWAARAAGLPESGGRAWYRRIEAAYRQAAAVAGLPPSRFQAILWIAVRDGIVRWAPCGTLVPDVQPRFGGRHRPRWGPTSAALEIHRLGATHRVDLGHEKLPRKNARGLRQVGPHGL